MAMAAMSAVCGSSSVTVNPCPSFAASRSSSSLAGRLFLGKPVPFNPLQAGSARFLPVPVRATMTTEETTTTTPTPTPTAATESSAQAEELLADLKAKWDAIENKSTVFIYGGGSLAALWVSSTIIGAVNSVPLLPKVLELVGLGYTGWFVYRYLLFKESRKELARDIEDLKSKIAGTGSE